MRVTILSGKREAFSVVRLHGAFAGAGHAVSLVNPYDCTLRFDRRGGGVRWGRRVLVPDIVVPRLSSRNATPYGLAVLRELETRGALAVNGADAVDRARDKLRTVQTLASRGIPVPLTLLMSKRSQLRREAGGLGLPAIVKLVRGTQGIGVMIADGPDALRTLLDTLWSLRIDALVQRFVAEARGRDIRALVVGGRVVAAMRRIAPVGEFRSNVHLGAATDRVVLDAGTRRVAVAAARALGLSVAGVDLLEASEGALVLEVNSSPSLEGIERASGVDVAARIASWAERAFEARRRSRPGTPLA